MEIKTENVDFKHLFKLTRIELDVVTFKKFTVKRSSGLSSSPGTEIIELGEEIGTETHKVTPELLAELVGNTGMVVKALVVKTTGKKIKKVFVSKVIKIDE